jgi:large conductance mechanosensitive channel
MSFTSEFKEFAVKGNVMDLAVGVIIGGAFGKIVESVVGDLVMPVVGRLLGNVDFSGLYVALKDIPPGVPPALDAVRKAGIPVFAYGNFITVAINFLILAFIIFLMVRLMNRSRKAAPPPATPEEIVLLREIRDSLKK